MIKTLLLGKKKKISGSTCRNNLPASLPLHISAGNKDQIKMCDASQVDFVNYCNLGSTIEMIFFFLNLQ